MRLGRVKTIVCVSAFQDTPENFVKVSLHLFYPIVVCVPMDLHRQVCTVGPLCSRHHWDPAVHRSVLCSTVRHP